VPPGDTAAWADSLVRLADAAARDDLGQRARAWVAEHRTWPIVMDAYRSAYHSVGVAGPHH
jgi:glycosyltransferase involved in cell wall biosynthesis